MTRHRSRRGAALAVFVVCFSVLVAVPVRAEDESRFEEPGIPYLDERDPWIEMGLGALIVLSCLLIAFKNPHRTHTG